MGNDQSSTSNPNSNNILVVTRNAFAQSNTTAPEFLAQIRTANDVEVQKYVTALQQLREAVKTMTDVAEDITKQAIEQVEDQHQSISTRVGELEELINSQDVSLDTKFKNLVRIAGGLKILEGTPFSSKRYIGTLQNGENVENVFFTEQLANDSKGYVGVVVVSEDELNRLSEEAPESAERTRDENGKVLTVAVARDTKYTALTIVPVGKGEQAFTLAFRGGCNCGGSRCGDGGKMEIKPIPEPKPEPTESENGENGENGENRQLSDENSRPRMQSMSMEQLMAMLGGGRGRAPNDSDDE